jgi:hypothetical protein
MYSPWTAKQEWYKSRTSKVKFLYLPERAKKLQSNVKAEAAEMKI